MSVGLKQSQNCCSVLFVFYFTTCIVQTSETKLQLNNAAGGRLKRYKILFYFRRSHILNCFSLI